MGIESFLATLAAYLLAKFWLHVGETRAKRRAEETELEKQHAEELLYLTSLVNQLVPDLYPEEWRGQLISIGREKLQETIRSAPAYRQKLLDRLSEIAPNRSTARQTIPFLEHELRRAEEESRAVQKERRRTILAGLRWRVLERDHRTCQYCGAKPPDVTLHVDHITPVSRGGRDTMRNLITACDRCNLGKSDRPLRRQAVFPKSPGPLTPSSKTVT